MVEPDVEEVAPTLLTVDEVTSDVVEEEVGLLGHTVSQGTRHSRTGRGLGSDEGQTQGGQERSGEKDYKIGTGRRDDGTTAYGPLPTHPQPGALPGWWDGSTGKVGRRVDGESRMDR